MPLLSIIEVAFVTGTNVWDTSNPAGKIWQSALQYLETCPGCEAVFCGTDSYDGNANGNVVVLVIPWDDEQAHSVFYESMGVSLAAGFLDRPITHKWITINEAGIGDTTAILSYSVNNTEKEKQHLMQEWGRFERSLQLGGAVTCQAGWVRSNYHTVETLQSEFIGIIAFKDCDVGDAAKFQTTLRSPDSRRILSLSRLSNIVCPVPTALDPSTPTSLSTLLQATPSIHFTPHPQRGSSGQNPIRDYDWNHRVEIDEEFPYNVKGSNGYPAPIGGYIPMRELQSPKDHWAYSRQKSILGQEDPHAQAGGHWVTISFNPGTMNNLLVNHGWWAPELPDTPPEVSPGGFEDDGDEDEDENDSRGPRGETTFDPVGPHPSEESFAWRAMKRKLLSVENCGMLLYGPTEENSDNVEIFIYWKASTASYDRHHTVTDSLFSHLAPYVKLGPKIEYYPSLSSLTPTGWSQYGDHYLEITKFYISPSPDLREHFEHYFFLFASSIEVRRPAFSNHHVSPAGRLDTASWKEGTELLNDTPAAVFLAIIKWENKESERQWYKDFKDGMLKSYERLGHKVDGLRAFILDKKSTHIRSRKYTQHDESDIGGYMF